jgi:hypothetical protein
MGKLPLLVVFAFAACQPMYGGKAPAMKNPSVVPESKRKIKTDDLPKKAEPIETCEWRTTPLPDPTKMPKRDAVRSQEATQRADQKQLGAERATDTKAKEALLIDSIQDYGAALNKDPYNAEATLKLALAYDKVLRKGCALKLINRLAKMTAHPKLERDANAKLDEIENHKTWFEDYRPEAMKATGRY